MIFKTSDGHRPGSAVEKWAYAQVQLGFSSIFLVYLMIFQIGAGKRHYETLKNYQI